MKQENSESREADNKLFEYLDLLIEKSRPIDYYWMDIRDNHFESLQKIRETGLANHLSLRTHAQIAIDFFEQTSPLETRQITQYFMQPGGEWCKELIEVTDESIILHEGNEGLIWNEAKLSYEALEDKPNLRPKTGIVEPRSKDLALEKLISIEDLNKVHPELVKYLMTRPHNQLPERLKESYLILPSPGIIKPVSINWLTGETYLIETTAGIAASRAYKEK